MLVSLIGCVRYTCWQVSYLTAWQTTTRLAIFNVRHFRKGPSAGRAKLVVCTGIHPHRDTAMRSSCEEEQVAVHAVNKSMPVMDGVRQRRGELA